MKKNYFGRLAGLVLAAGMMFGLTSCEDILGEWDKPTPVVQEVINTVVEVTGATPEAVTAALQAVVTDEAVAAAAAKGEPIKVTISTNTGIASEAADKTITIPQKNGANIEIVFDALPTGTDTNGLEFKAEGVTEGAASGNSQNQLAISMPDAAVSAQLSIVIEMPSTTVTLKNNGGSGTTYKAVSSKTANQTLILEEGVTINGSLKIYGGSVDARAGHVKGNIYLMGENMGEVHLALNPEDQPEYLSFMEKGNTLVFDTDVPKIPSIINDSRDPKTREDIKIAFNWFNVEEGNVFNRADLRWFNGLHDLVVAVYDDGETVPGKALLVNVPANTNNVEFGSNQISYRYPGNEFEDKGPGFDERNGSSVPDKETNSVTISKCTFNCAKLDGEARFKAPYVEISIPDPFGTLRTSMTYTFDNCQFANPDENFDFRWNYPVPETEYGAEYPVTLVFKDCKFGDADFAIESAFFNWMKNNSHGEMDKKVAYKIQIVKGETTQTYQLEKDGEDKCKFTVVE